VLAIALSLLAAASNSAATILQRRTARSVPSEDRFRVRLLRELLPQPAWLAGIGCLILGFVFQAAALSQSGLSLVQPLLAAELPLTLLLASRVFHRSMDRHAWIGAIGVGCGITTVLLALQPRIGEEIPSPARWTGALLVIAVVVTALLVAGRSGGSAGAALMGAAAGAGFGATAALMKGASHFLPDGVGAVLAHWQVYGMAGAGLISLFLLQNALQSGTLVAAQPALTTADPIVGVLLGIALFGDHVRQGWWLLLAVAGFAAMTLASVELSRSGAMSRVSD
jgi:hypothetical protein